jgi:hypothetical protein
MTEMTDSRISVKPSVNNNRQDKAGMMSQLSQEFEWHMQIAEEYATKKYFGGAEALRLIAESIHGTLSTFEAIEE